MAAGLNVATAQYSLQIGNVTWTGSPGGYNCFSGTAYPNTVDFTITKQQPGRQDYAVAAGPSGNTGSYSRQMASGANRLGYQLYTTSGLNNVLKTPPTASATEVISGSMSHGSGLVIPLSFVLYISPNQLVPPGIYTDQITISVYDSYNDTRAPMATRTITITAVVIPGAALSLVPSGSSFNGNTSQSLNFGTLTQDKSLGCDLLIRKNTSCNITFSSINSGVMKAIPTPTSDHVPYACTVNGNLLNLATPAQMNLPSGVSPSQDGNRLPINITVGDPANAAAGDYQDQITITVVAL